MAILIATHGPKHGRCNICGEDGVLTEDHTPPKGSIRIGQVALRRLVEKLGADRPKPRRRLSQNGVKYRTLCGRCSNGRLGLNFDIAFNSFVNQVSSVLQSPIELPDCISVNANPQKIMRAVLGHLAALGVDRYEKGPDTEPLRDYFLDDTLPLPDSINIYYWIFPYKGQVLTRDCAYMDLRVGKPVGIWFLKFFPIAFLVTWDEPAGYIFGLPNLATWRTACIDHVAELPLLLRPVVRQDWPEAPTEHSVVTYGRDAIFAERLKR